MNSPETVECTPVRPPYGFIQTHTNGSALALEAVSWLRLKQSNQQTKNNNPTRKETAP
jgi:hypothetical protein